MYPGQVARHPLFVWFRWQLSLLGSVGASVQTSIHFNSITLCTRLLGRCCSRSVGHPTSTHSIPLDAHHYPLSKPHNSPRLQESRCHGVLISGEIRHLVMFEELEALQTRGFLPCLTRWWWWHMLQVMLAHGSPAAA